MLSSTKKKAIDSPIKKKYSRLQNDDSSDLPNMPIQPLSSRVTHNIESTSHISPTRRSNLSRLSKDQIDQKVSRIERSMSQTQRVNYSSYKQAKTSPRVKTSGGQPSHHKLASQINIVEQLNGQNIKWQDYEIEIERLQTTCRALNSKANLVEDMGKDLEMQKVRISELESQGFYKEKECKSLKEENRLLGDRIRRL